MIIIKTLLTIIYNIVADIIADQFIMIEKRKKRVKK